MNNEHIEADEILYRAILGNMYELIQRNAPRAPLFIDNNGLSVDRDGTRSEQEIIESFANRFKKARFHAAAKIGAKTCINIGTYPVPRPSKNNPYHAEIHESPDEVRISRIKAMELASKCIIINPDIA